MYFESRGYDNCFYDNLKRSILLTYYDPFLLIVPKNSKRDKKIGTILVWKRWLKFISANYKIMSLFDLGQINDNSDVIPQ